MLEKFLEETPAKVMTLLCVAMASLAFLFVVSSTDSSFTGTRVSVPSPSPEKVMAVLDYTAAGYSHFLQANLFNPVEQSVAMTTDNVSWIASNAAYSLGINSSSQAAPMVSRVAGAHIVAPAQTPAQSSSAAPEKTSEAPQGVFSPILALLTQ